MFFACITMSSFGMLVLQLIVENLLVTESLASFKRRLAFGTLIRLFWSAVGKQILRLFGGSCSVSVGGISEDMISSTTEEYRTSQRIFPQQGGLKTNRSN